MPCARQTWLIVIIAHRAACGDRRWHGWSITVHICRFRMSTSNIRCHRSLVDRVTNGRGYSACVFHNRTMVSRLRAERTGLLTCIVARRANDRRSTSPVSRSDDICSRLLIGAFARRPLVRRGVVHIRPRLSLRSRCRSRVLISRPRRVPIRIVGRRCRTHAALVDTARRCFARRDGCSGGRVLRRGRPFGRDARRGVYMPRAQRGHTSRRRPAVFRHVAGDTPATFTQRLVALRLRQVHDDRRGVQPQHRLAPITRQRVVRYTQPRQWRQRTQPFERQRAKPIGRDVQRLQRRLLRERQHAESIEPVLLQIEPLQRRLVAEAFRREVRDPVVTQVERLHTLGVVERVPVDGANRVASEVERRQHAQLTERVVRQVGRQQVVVQVEVLQAPETLELIAVDGTNVVVRQRQRVKSRQAVERLRWNIDNSVSVHRHRNELAERSEVLVVDLDDLVTVEEHALHYSTAGEPSATDL